MPTANWKRTGELLVRRRVELDPRYSNRRLFVAERGIGYRIVTDLEHGRRGNYEPATLTAAEVAYELVAGSIVRTATGGPLEPLPAPDPVEAPADPPNPFGEVAADEPEGDAAWTMFPNPVDRPLRAIWRLSTVPYKVRVEKVAELIEWREASLKPPGRESAGLPVPDCNGSDT